MIRRLDNNGDWTFGSGKGAYIGGIDGLALRLETQLREWKGDCFFALERGISWHLMDKREQIAIREIRDALMGNPEVLGIGSFELEKTEDRKWIPKITLMTIYGEAAIWAR